MTRPSTRTTFEIAAETTIEADADTVFEYVSDLTRAGEWSPECTGGVWLEGGPGEVGARFEGHNRRSVDVVAWAPVVRGDWTTISTIIVAERPIAFQWAMCDSGGAPQESVWGFEITPAGPSSTLRHTFHMGQTTEGLGEILAELSTGDQQRFLSEWADKLRGEMTLVVAAIKARLEQPDPAPQRG